MIRRTRMRRRFSWRLRPIPSKYLFLLTLFLFIAMVLQTFYYIERNLTPTIKEIARFKVEQLATKAINDAVSKNIMQGTDFRQLVEFQKDQNGQIQSALFNNTEYARIVGETTTQVTHTLDEIEKVPQKIPLGQVLQSNLLASFGPNIPINLVPLGDVQVNIETRFQNSGVNNVLYTAVLIIKTKAQIVIPFSTEPATVKSEIPLSSVLIVGNVPQFYYDGNGNPVGSDKPGIQPPNIMPPVQANTSVEKP